MKFENLMKAPEFKDMVKEANDVKNAYSENIEVSDVPQDLQDILH